MKRRKAPERTRKMIEQATLDRGQRPATTMRQAPNGARSSKAPTQVFLAQGFDAASMNDIARAAGVSKGTLYVYFDNKEELFEAIVEEECDAQAEGIFDLDPERSRRRSGADAARRRLRQIPVPAREGLGDPHRDRDRRSHAGDRPQVLRDRTGDRHRAARRLIWPRRSRPACSPSTIARSPRRSSWNPATRCCSSRSCSTSRRRRAPSRSSAGWELPSRHFSPLIGQTRHCEERSDEAIQSFAAGLDCFAPLAKTPVGYDALGGFAVDRVSHVGRYCPANRMCSR